MKTLSQKRRNINIQTINESFCQSSFQEIISSSRATQTNKYNEEEYSKHVMQNIKNPARIADVRSSISNFGGGKLLFIKLLIFVLDNLMNPLARKFKNICDCTQRFTALVHFNNLNVPAFINRWARTQRAPLPIRDIFKHLDAVIAQLLFLVPLSHITHPGAQRDLVALNYLDKNSRDSAVPFAFSEYLQAFNCKFESSRVVHMPDNSKQTFGGAD